MRLVGALPRVARCDDLGALDEQRRRLPPPDDLAITQEVEALQDALAQSRAQELAGRYTPALEQLDAALARAEAVDYPPLVAELEQVRGRVLAARGRLPEAEQALERAYAIALRHRHDAVVRHAAETLVFVVGDLQSRPLDGDRRAATVLVERYSTMLQRFFRNKVRDSEAAAELISETMLACVGALERAQPTGSFRSFLFGVALNTLRAYIRRKYKRKRERDDFDDVCVGDDTETPSGLVSRSGETRLLVRALRRIPLKFQVVLELQFFEELTGPQIAELLDMPLATVYTHQRRGRARLQEVIQELADNPQLAQSTMMGIETWAEDVRAQIGDSARSS